MHIISDKIVVVDKKRNSIMYSKIWECLWIMSVLYTPRWTSSFILIFFIWITYSFLIWLLYIMCCIIKHVLKLWYTVKPAHVVTCLKRSLFFLSCHRRFRMNWTSFKRSPVLKVHFFCIKGDLLIHVVIICIMEKISWLWFM